MGGGGGDRQKRRVTAFGGDKNVLKLVVGMIHNSVNTLKTTEVHALNRLIVWYVN